VLDAAEVDVADDRAAAGLRHEVLDQDAVLEDADLRRVALLDHDHGALDRLAAGEELGLGQDRRAAAARLAAVAAALALRLQPRRAAHAAHLVTSRALLLGLGLADVHHRVRRVVRRLGGFLSLSALTTATAAAAPAATLRLGLRFAVGLGFLGLGGLGLFLLRPGLLGLIGLGLVAVLGALAPATAAATATAATPGAVRVGLLGGFGGGRGLLGLLLYFLGFLGLDLGGLGDDGRLRLALTARLDRLGRQEHRRRRGEHRQVGPRQRARRLRLFRLGDRDRRHRRPSRGHLLGPFPRFFRGG